MPQEIKGTPIPNTPTNDNNKAVSKPSPADSDKNQAVSKPDMDPAIVQKAFQGIRKPDTSKVGPSIFDKSE
jgi:hypothetical protein